MKKFAYNEQRIINALSQFNTPLDIHIGKTVKYKKPTCLIQYETFVIRHIQKDYKGDLAYNLVCITGDTAGSLAAQFGQCCSPDEVYFLNSEN